MIDENQKLEGFLAHLKSTPWVALDTEADSLHAYPEKLCLIQISTVAGDELIDPLANLNLAPLLKALRPHELILHGADYDLRLLRKHHDFVPHAIFDTMLAARLLGCAEFGLSNLLGSRLGVTLDKGSQKANWARRPLTERMEIYARNDTHYLKSLAENLQQELAVKGRSGWHQESCARLIAECSQQPVVDPNLSWRIKGSYSLSRQGMAVVRELWSWREAEAIRANRPPFFILSHETLVKLADAAAGGNSGESLLPHHISERRRAGLKAAIARGLEVPPDQQPRHIRQISRRPSEAERRRFNELQKRRDHHAETLGIDPTLIASRATLIALAEAWDKHLFELMKWQQELLK